MLNLDLIRQFFMPQFIFGIDDGGGAPPSDDAPPSGTDEPPPSDDAPPSGTDEPPPSDDAPQPWHATLPETWREDIAGDDEARLNDLKRYGTLADWMNSGFSAKDRIRKAEVSTGLPDDPSDEQLAAFREANGIPAEADGYAFESDNVELNENDQRLYGAVSAVAHGLNMPASHLNAITEAMVAERDAVIKEMEDADGVQKQQAERVLRDNWGADYQANMGAAMTLVRGLPDDIQDQFLNGRDADGRLLMSNPAIVQWLTDTARKAYPGVDLSGDTETGGAAAAEVIAEVKDIFARGEEKEKYWNNADLQARYQKAIEAQQRMQQ